jgi:hypothetical protein
VVTDIGIVGARTVKKLLGGKPGGGRRKENLENYGGWMMSNWTGGIWV